MIVQMCTSTSDSTQDDSEDFYKQRHRKLNGIPLKDIAVVQGD